MYKFANLLAIKPVSEEYVAPDTGTVYKDFPPELKSISPESIQALVKHIESAVMGIIGQSARESDLDPMQLTHYVMHDLINLLKVHAPQKTIGFR